MTQIVVRMGDELTAAIDAAVNAGEAESRSALLRRAVIELLDRRRRDTVVQATLAAYLAHPQSSEELEGIDAAGRELIGEEPW